MLPSLFCGIFFLALLKNTLNEEYENLSDLSESKMSAQIERAGFIEFEQFAKEYMSTKEREFYRSVSWWDLYGKHPYLQENKKYDKYKIFVTMGPLTFSNKTEVSRTSEIVHRQTVSNNASFPLMRNVTKTDLPTREYRWQVTQGIKIQPNTAIKTKLPGNLTDTITINFQAQEEQVAKKPATFSVTTAVTVAPHSSLEVNLHVQRTETRYMFRAFVYIDGYLAFWLYERYQGHWLWFHPTCLMADNRFRSNGNGLLRLVTGKLVVIKYENSMVEKKLYPIYY